MDRISTEKHSRPVADGLDDKLLRMALAAGVRERWYRRYMASVRQQLPSQVESFRSCEAPTQWSVAERRLDRLRRKPKDVYGLIVKMGGSLTEDGLRAALQKNPVLPVVFYQFAALLPPKGHAELRIADGSAYQEFLNDHQLPRLKVAIRNALAQFAPSISRGRGGDRRRGRWSTINTMIGHLLGVYHDVTQDRPGYSQFPGRPLSGLAVEFVRDGLARAGLGRVSDDTLKRRIQGYREQNV